MNRAWGHAAGQSTLAMGGTLEGGVNVVNVGLLHGHVVIIVSVSLVCEARNCSARLRESLDTLTVVHVPHKPLLGLLVQLAGPLG